MDCLWRMLLSRAYVVYFSRADEKYGVGNIEKGNTQIVAEMIGEQLKCDTFHIETVFPYPSDYDECTEVAKRELSDNDARPELTEFPDLTEYDTIFVGYPIWARYANVYSEWLEKINIE